MKDKKVYNIHIRASKEIYYKWIIITKHLDGTTQSAIFRSLVNKLYTSLMEIYNIKHYEAREES